MSESTKSNVSFKDAVKQTLCQVSHGTGAFFKIYSLYILASIFAQFFQPNPENTGILDLLFSLILLPALLYATFSAFLGAYDFFLKEKAPNSFFSAYAYSSRLLRLFGYTLLIVLITLPFIVIGTYLLLFVLPQDQSLVVIAITILVALIYIWLYTRLNFFSLLIAEQFKGPVLKESFRISGPIQWKLLAFIMIGGLFLGIAMFIPSFIVAFVMGSIDEAWLVTEENYIISVVASIVSAYAGWILVGCLANIYKQAKNVG